MAKMIIDDRNNFQERYVVPNDFRTADKWLRKPNRFVAIWKDINGTVYDRDVFIGSGLKYSAGDPLFGTNPGAMTGTLPSDGTITKWIAEHGNGYLAKITGLNIDAANLPAYRSVTEAYADLLRSDDLIRGGKGNDWVDGHGGADVMYGGDGDDLLRGGTGYEDDGAADRLYGGSGNDSLIANDGDTLFGGVGNDSLQRGHSTTGSARMLGGMGDDNYFLANPSDVVVEKKGEGIDTVVVNWTSGLPRHVENLSLFEPAGSTGTFVGTGNNGSNSLYGSASTGKVILRGMGGADRLRGTGNVVMEGGKGKDVFAYGSSSFMGQNIRDFSRAQGDKIEFLSNAYGFGGLAPGELEAQNFRSNLNGTAKDADDYFVFSTKSKTLFYDADGNGAGEKLKVAKFSNGFKLKNTDIQLTDTYIA